MFVETRGRERLSVNPSAESLREEIVAALRKRVAGAYIRGKGLCLFPTAIESVADITVYEGMLFPLVTFKMVAFRVYPGEVIACKVERQDITGVRLSSALISDVFVPRSLLPEPQESVSVANRTGGESLLWAWRYSENKLYIKTGDTCRVRAVRVDDAPLPEGAASGRDQTQASKACVVYGTMADAGLGPVQWW